MAAPSAVSVKKFYRFTFLRKLNYMAVLSFFIPKLNSTQTPVCQCLLLRYVAQQTDGQYRYYVRECLSSKIICVEHYHLLTRELVQYFKILILKNHSHLNWQAIQNSDSCIALTHCNHKKLFFFYVFPLSLRLF